MMKIVFSNIGSVSEASIELSNLTVISGENDSGKTTVSKIAYALGQASSSFKYDFKKHQNYEIRNLFDELYMYLTRGLKRNIFHDERVGNLHYEINSKEKELDSELNEFLYNLRRDSMFVGLSAFEMQRIDNLVTRLLKMDIYNERIATKISELLSKIKLKLEELGSEPTSKFIHRALKSEFSDEIIKKNNNNENILAKLSLFDSDFEIFNIIFDDKKVIDFSGDTLLRISDSTFVEGPSVFQVCSALNGGVFDRDFFNQNNRKNKSIPYHLLDLCSKLNGTRETLNSINDLCHNSAWNISNFYNGFMDYESKQEFFQLNKDGYKFPGNNTSSGMKAIAILDLLIKGGYINKDSILILDEPETNLHPRWQKKYAKAITELACSGARILVNTHSPYMLEALKIYSHLNDNEEYSYRFYFSKKEKNGVSFVNTHGDISEIISALSEPLNELFDEYQGNIDDF
ncbi:MULTISPECIES: AAA family ATPase [Proteus]|uniref:AAA family ATPase n=1 Tax=Proteus TaxID=583 RepID=UPI001377FC37|nr:MULTISPECIES: AAA family ATPase [Proteus]NBM92716.1 AAA family ATPase [Proteus sp. G2662]